MPKEELIEPKPEKIETQPEKKEPEAEKPDPLKELEERLTAKFLKEIEARDGEIASLKKPKEPGPTVVEKIDVYKDLATKIWEDTPSAIKALRDEIKKEVTEDLTSKYQASRNEERFWSDFYDETPSLNRKTDHWIVNAVLNENLQAWGNLPFPKLKKELAAEVESRVARLEARKERKGDDKSPSLSLSSASSPTPKREAEPEKPKTLSQLIKDRQQQRQTALFKRQQEPRPRDDTGRFTRSVN